MMQKYGPKEYKESVNINFGMLRENHTSSHAAEELQFLKLLHPDKDVREIDDSSDFEELIKELCNKILESSGEYFVGLTRNSNANDDEYENWDMERITSLLKEVKDRLRLFVS